MTRSVQQLSGLPPHALRRAGGLRTRKMA
jgi:uncharacterized protein YjeT (DUF2065 family)